MKYDVFISHASEDKPEVVRPLFEKLTAMGVKVWLDEHELTLGDSLRRNIDLGLSNSRFGVVILSHAFFAKEWPQKELDGLVAREDGREKVILPIWHNLTIKDVRSYSLLLADRVGGTTSRGVDFLAEQIMKALEVESKRQQLSTQTQGRVEETASVLKQNFEDGPDRSAEGFMPLQGLLMAALDRVQERADNNMGDVTGVRTGLVDYDSLTLGLHKREVTLVGARPLVGKTSLVLTIANNVATSEGLPVVVIAAGYNEAQFTDRLIGIAGFIDTKHIESGMLTDDEWGRLSEAIEALHHANVFFVEDPELTVDDAITKTRKLAVQFGGTLGLVVIDGDQAVKPPVGSGSERGIEETFKSIRGLARDLSCPILVTMPLSRTVDTRVDRTPQISDILDIDQLERYVDNIVFIRPEIAEPKRSVAQIIVARQRRGPVGSVDVVFLQRTGQFLNLAPDDFNDEHS